MSDDTQVRLRHFVFFETLAQAPDESSPVWRATTAGLMVLRLADGWAAQGPTVITGNEWGIHVIRRAVTLIDHADPLRVRIMDVLNAMRRDPERSPSDLIPYLVAYGEGLEAAGQWALAADVYLTITDSCATSATDRVAIVGAHLRRGACLGELGQWQDAASAFAIAWRVAKVTGDHELIDRARAARVWARRPEEFGH